MCLLLKMFTSNFILALLLLSLNVSNSIFSWASVTLTIKSLHLLIINRKRFATKIIIIDKNSKRIRKNKLLFRGIVLLSPKTPLVGERWDYKDQQVFKSLLHSLQCGDHMQSWSKKASYAKYYSSKCYFAQTHCAHTQNIYHRLIS